MGANNHKLIFYNSNKIVKNKKFGRIIHINFERTNLGPVRKDVSALWDLTAHDLSILLAINNILPKKISVNGGKFIDKNIFRLTK